MPVIETATRRIRTSGKNPTTKREGLSGWSWGNRSATGVTVDDRAALSLIPFYRGVSLIASTVAGLPIHVHQENDDGSKVRIKTEDTAYLWRRPNPEMTKQSFWERIVADEVRGNGFIWVEKEEEQIKAIWWLYRQRVRVGRTTEGRKVYEVDGELPMIDYRDGGEIVHIPNWGDSLVGYDPIDIAAGAIALGLSAEDYAEETFGHGQIPPGIISTPDKTLTPEESDEIAARWAAKYSGVKNSMKPAVLGHGATFQTIERDLEKMQMESTRKYQAGEYATLLGIAPHLLGQVDRTTSWGSGIAEQGQATITYTLNSHTTRIKQAIDDALLVRELTNRYVEFDPGGLLRGSVLQQYQAHAIAYGRWMTVNEIRADQNMEPIEGGDVLLAPVNMAPMEALESMQIERAAQGGRG